MKAVSLLVPALLLAGCATPRSGGDPEPSHPAPEAAAPAAVEQPNRSIRVCGHDVPIGTRVVLWDEPPYYDAHRTVPRFDPDAAAGEGLRYQPGREGVGDAPTRAELAAAVDQFVLHYDVCGSSERCFRVLHDLRGLSVHFLLDVDGTIYQTLDLREQAWHATKSNPRSIGIEIANIGAYPPGDAQALWDWYGVEPGADEAWVEDGMGPGRTARVAFLEGVVQDTRLVQAQVTPAQYASLVKLAAGLVRTFPRMAADAPRGPDGVLRDGVLSDEEWDAFGGILGHHHVQRNKVDPGPAFPWERFLEDVRAELGR